MLRYVLPILLLITATVAQADDYVVVSSIGTELKTSSPAGTQVEFTCVDLPGSATPFFYEWTVINLEDSSVEYTGFNDPTITMTPIDKYRIAVFCTVYDMMLTSLGTTSTINYTWKPATQILHGTLPSNVTYVNSITFPLFFADAQSELMPGRCKITRQAESGWLHVGLTMYGGNSYVMLGGYYNLTAIHSELPSSVLAGIFGNDPPGTYIDTLTHKYLIESWDSENEVWDYEAIVTVNIRLLKGDTPGTYTLSD